MSHILVVVPESGMSRHTAEQVDVMRTAGHIVTVRRLDWVTTGHDSSVLIMDEIIPTSIPKLSKSLDLRGNASEAKLARRAQIKRGKK